MKTYMKFIGIIALLALEILAISKISYFGLENIFALLGGAFGILFYRQFFNFDRAPSVHNTPGGSISGTLHSTTHITLTTGEHDETKHTRAAFQNKSIKLAYLTLTLVHMGLCYYFVKFPS